MERTLTTGEIVSVGVLAQNHQGVFFQYDKSYLSRFGNLSRYVMRLDSLLRLQPGVINQNIEIEVTHATDWHL
ncbi:hypothetical protein VEZ01S_45_00830 [Vibrio ezurae NBRC 102218]|uniref:Uncharacterized protein n=1 Tax=Vibrio ezurae NBRC 102218 TaxID=1219080 RepID=U3B697_9VIBR|nr:hypothetical protein VEZ01S_45_00830 [Vibrio ezurae NBRC 102218]